MSALSLTHGWLWLATAGVAVGRAANHGKAANVVFGWLWVAERTTARPGIQAEGHENSFARSPRPLVAALLIALLAGCESQPVVTPSSPGGDKVSVARGGDDISQALDSLRKLAAGGGDQASSRTIYYLNQWLNGGRTVEGTWEPDRLSENIPRALKNTPGLDRLGDFTFVPPVDPSGQPTGSQDLLYLQQVLWLNDVAQRIRKEPPPKQLAPWIAEIEKSGRLLESEQLAAAQRLFDWTVRNIQLEPLPPPPKGPAATAGEGTDPVTPAALGEVGPGYAHLPLQLLLQGHGDAHERARLFILLCRQAGIDAVIVARIDEQVSSTPQPWAVGVLVDQDLYLFEPQLGLPIPGPDGKGIATLAQTLADPAVLKQLDVPGGPAYPLGPEQLKNLVALIEAEPESLSRRFDLLEQAMPSSRRLILASHPSKLEPRLRQSKGIGSVSLWRVPFEAVQFSRSWNIDREPDKDKRFELASEGRAYVVAGLALGRNYHLQGKFDGDDQLQGARSLYMQARKSDAERESLYISPEFRRLHGIPEMPEQEDQKKEALEALNGMYLRAKQNASYWMGLVHYEAGNYDAAIEWLDERTIKSPLPSPWLAGARYNLGRSYEALGQNDKAIAWLQADADSPQRHGNLLRAAWLAEHK